MRISDWSSDVCSSDLRCAQRWAPSPCRPSHESCRSAAPDRSSALAGLPDQDRPRLVAVPLDLLDQRIDAVEADLAAQAGLEDPADGFVVEVHGAVEHGDPEHARVGTELEGPTPPQRPPRGQPLSSQRAPPPAVAPARPPTDLPG